MAKRGETDSVLKRIFDEARKRPKGRSELAKALTRDHDEFAARLAEGPVSWEALAEEFGKAGYRDAKGEAPDGDRLRRTWKDVAKRVQKARQKGGVSAPMPQHRQTTPEQKRDPASDPADHLARVRAEMNKRSGKDDDGGK